ncbi:hypothetical protein BCR34DRAFT_580911 [Clohesyomyces aquaticus]|uniref:Putative gamma-glutamylcyclotransferase n=1 Tax=Clohesyomyces aquaticus TaxID=1231657 RepID=A0A1Y1Y3Y4_9PLEO|nr:hypothetical protein BCR34DRAFT_580911 [Clohesyomyces aquaticus]
MTHSGDGHSETTSAIPRNERSTPPPPPPPLPPKARPKAAIPPAPPLPSTSGPAIRNSDFLRVMSAASSTEPQQSASPERLFQPCYMFFYGSLMDPEVLQSILELPELPIIRHGSVTGFSVKMWGIYPALVRNGSETVSGTVWKATSESQFLRLAAYETSVYTWCECDIRLSDSEVLHHCRTFCWAGDPCSQELEEGSFDLERYQRYFKSSVTRGRTT